MAKTGHNVVTVESICDIVSRWPMCEQHGDEYAIVTHCQYPNGSLVKVRVRRSGNGWIVSDGGMSLDEALSSGIEKPEFGLNVRRVIRSKGLSFTEGRIESPNIDLSSLFNAVVVVANAAREVAETLIYVGSHFEEDALDVRIRKILVGRFHAWVLKRPLLIHGASERIHKFHNVVEIPDGRRVLIDTVKHQGNSINSTIVANLDIMRLENHSIVQRIVFDPTENWKAEEIELLSVGAMPVALPSLTASIERIAA